MSRHRAWLLAAVLLAAAVGPAASGAVGQAPTPVQLAGSFVMHGRVTAESNVRGEHVGQIVTRTWTFTPGCHAAPCRTVILHRQRAGGTDALTLTERQPGYYTGTGRFYRPVKCGNRVYRPGERIPYTIRVWVIGTTAVNGQTLASALAATYVNVTRQNLTPCVAELGHDSARYLGVVSPAG